MKNHNSKGNKSFLAGIITGVVMTVTVISFTSQTSAANLSKNISASYQNIKIYVDGAAVNTKDTNEPFISSGVTYLPVRAVGEAFGKTVDWDGVSKTVYIGVKPLITPTPVPTATVVSTPIATPITDTNVTKKINDIVSTQTSSNQSDYQKAKNLHDYLIKASKFNSTIGSNAAYDMLFTGVGSGIDYTNCYKALLDKAGVTSMIVHGSALGVAHSWNLIKIESDWYHVDVCFDDPDFLDNNYIEYDYFCVTDTAISYNHDWSRSAYPACTATKYDPMLIYYGN